MTYLPLPAASTPSIRDATRSPVVLPSGKAATPFTNVAVDESKVGATETVTIVLSPDNTANAPADFGALADPMGGGSYNASTHTFTETAVATGVPTAATTILQRLVYTPPTPAPGSFIAVDAAVSVSVSGNPMPAADAQPVVLDTVTPPGAQRHGRQRAHCQRRHDPALRQHARRRLQPAQRCSGRRRHHPHRWQQHSHRC